MSPQQVTMHSALIRCGVCASASAWVSCAVTFASIGRGTADQRSQRSAGGSPPAVRNLTATRRRSPPASTLSALRQRAAAARAAWSSARTPLLSCTRTKVTCPSSHTSTTSTTRALPATTVPAGKCGNGSGLKPAAARSACSVHRSPSAALAGPPSSCAGAADARGRGGTHNPVPSASVPRGGSARSASGSSEGGVTESAAL